MPWNFHVTKRFAPSERGAEITLTEWTDLIARDPDLTLVASSYVRSKVTPHSAALWFGHSERQGAIAFELLAGNVTVERPDAQTLCKLREIAALLGGHVEDDDGGWYDVRGHFLGHLATG